MMWHPRLGWLMEPYVCRDPEGDWILEEQERLRDRDEAEAPQDEVYVSDPGRQDA